MLPSASRSGSGSRRAASHRRGNPLLLLVGYAFSWVFALIGLIASSPEAANAYGFTILFPVTFVSSAFVPVQSMPSWLQPVADNNPFTNMVNAARSLFVGTPAGNQIWLAVVWALGSQPCSACLRSGATGTPSGRKTTHLACAGSTGRAICSL